MSASKSPLDVKKTEFIAINLMMNFFLNTGIFSLEIKIGGGKIPYSMAQIIIFTFALKNPIIMGHVCMHEIGYLLL